MMSYVIGNVIFSIETNANTVIVRNSLVMLLVSLCLLTDAHDFSSKRSAISSKFRSLADANRKESASGDLLFSNEQYMPLFNVELPLTSAAQPNLFEEYISRELYRCTSSYLDALGKLHALIVQVYDNYQICQKLKKSTPKVFSMTNVDALEEALTDWQLEDGVNRRKSTFEFQKYLTSTKSVKEQTSRASTVTPKPAVMTQL